VIGPIEAIASLQRAGFKPKRSIEVLMFTSEAGGGGYASQRISLRCHLELSHLSAVRCVYRYV